MSMHTYAIGLESNDQNLRFSDSQILKLSDCQIVSNSRTIRKSRRLPGSQILRLSRSQSLRLSNSVLLRISDCHILGFSDSHIIRHSDSDTLWACTRTQSDWILRFSGSHTEILRVSDRQSSTNFPTPLESPRLPGLPDSQLPNSQILRFRNLGSTLTYSIGLHSQTLRLSDSLTLRL